MQDDGTAGDGEILDLARVGAVDASRTSVALRTLSRGRYTAQVNVHRIVEAEHTLDAQASQMGHRYRDAQGAPPVGSRSPARTSFQYYVSWSACTESETDPVPD
jgi:hypothetical protein